VILAVLVSVCAMTFPALAAGREPVEAPELWQTYANGCLDVAKKSFEDKYGTGGYYALFMLHPGGEPVDWQTRYVVIYSKTPVLGEGLVAYGMLYHHQGYPPGLAGGSYHYNLAAFDCQALALTGGSPRLAFQGTESKYNFDYYFADLSTARIAGMDT